MKYITQASGLFAATMIAASLSALVVLPAHAAPRNDTAPIGQRDFVSSVPASPSHLTRSEVRQQVLAARAEGTLTPAGQGNELYAFSPSAASTLTRGEVKADVAAAQKSGELQAQGEEESALQARAPHRGVPVADATHRNVFSVWLAKHRAANAASGT